jgi:hypothetical protein
MIERLLERELNVILDHICLIALKPLTLGNRR